jgi:DNA-binding NarL/FixJ family response regulator
MKAIRVLIVDDEAAVLRGLRMRLGLEPDIDVVGEAADGSAAIDLAARLSPDVVLMDIRMPVMDGIEATRTLAGRNPAPAVVILSMRDDTRTVALAGEAGAVGFVAKHSIDDGLAGAIRRAAAGQGGDF